MAPEPAARRTSIDVALRRVVALNLGYFLIEIVAALAAHSVSLLADSVDFLEDAAISTLILAAFSWSSRARGRLGMVLAGIILVPGFATLVMAWLRFGAATPPDPTTITLIGAGALLVNMICVWLLARQRSGGGNLMRAAFLSARNDTLANLAVIATGFATMATRSPWPDLAVGIGIGLLNAGAAWEVFEAAREEHRQPAETHPDHNCV